MVNYHQLAEKWQLRPVELSGVQSFGALYYEIDTCPSTNDLLQEMALAQFPHGTVVRAIDQTAGRGRRGAAWFSSPNALQFSLLVRPDPQLFNDHGAADLPFINVLISYAMLKTIHQVSKLPAVLKWPNDILIGGRKVCGVMSEMRTSSATDQPPHIVVGCGLNLNVAKSELPAELRSSATSLASEARRTFEARELIAAFLHEFSGLYLAYQRSQSH